MDSKNKVKPENCNFGKHINSIDKERLIELCKNTIKEQAPEALDEMEQEEIKSLYTNFVMEKDSYGAPNGKDGRLL